MAQTGNDILGQLLAVTKQINKKLDGSSQTAPKGGKSDKGTGSIINSLGKGKTNKAINKTTLAVTGLFDTFTKAGDNKRTIVKGVKLFERIINSLKDGAPVVQKYAKAFSSFMKTFGLGILLITGSIVLSGKLLGTNNPVATFLAISTIVLGMVGLMYLLAKAGPHVKKGIKTAKNMGQAMMTIGLGFITLVGSLKLISVMAGGGSIAYGGLLALGVIVATATTFAILGKLSKPIEEGAKTAAEMGIGMIAMAAGIYFIALASKAITGMGDSTASKIVKDAEGNKTSQQKGGFGQLMSSVGPGLGMIGIVMVSSALLFFGLGFISPGISLGTGVMWGMASGMVAMSLGVFAVALASKAITGMGDSTASKIVKDAEGNKTSQQKGGFGQLMSSVGPGLGMMGIVMVSSAMLFFGLGIISPGIGFGILAGLGIAVALVGISYAIKKVMQISKEFKDEDVAATVKSLTGDVLTGFINGIGGALSGGKGTTLAGLGNALKNTAIITTGITLLMGVSVTLSMFAYALTAFANLGNMRVIESYDKKTGKPKFGPTVDIAGVGETVTNTIGQFLKGLIKNTHALEFGQASKIKRMGKALTGKRGILRAVMDFTDVIKAYAQFGPKGEIGYTMIDYDSKGNAKLKPDGSPKMISRSVPIKAVAENVATAIGSFINELTTQTQDVAFSRKNKTAMLRLSEALMGKKRGKFVSFFAGDSTGLLEPIDKFAQTLMIYSKFGDGDKMPIFDNEGNPIEGEFISMKDVASKIATSITGFSTELTKAMKTVDPSAAKDAANEMEKYVSLISQISALAEASETLMLTSDAITKLSASIALLGKSLNIIDADKLNNLTGINDSKVKMISRKIGNKFGESVLAVQAKVENIKSKSNSNTEDKDRKETNLLLKNIYTESIKLREDLTRSFSGSNDGYGLASAIGSEVGKAFQNQQFYFDFAWKNGGTLKMEEV